MPEDINEIPFYMDCVEKQYEMFEVPQDIRVHLMQPYLSDRAKCLLSLLNGHDLDTFDKFKLKILQEFRLTPTKYRENFMTAEKRPEESWQNCTARITAMLKFYLQSRKVETLGKLKDLLVADRIKDMLPKSARNFICNKEVEDWLLPADIATHVEQYQANFELSEKKPVVQVFSTNVVTQGNSTRGNVNHANVQRSAHVNSVAKVECFSCGGPHYRRNCPVQSNHALNGYRGRGHYGGHRDRGFHRGRGFYQGGRGHAGTQGFNSYNTHFRGHNYANGPNLNNNNRNGASVNRVAVVDDLHADLQVGADNYDWDLREDLGKGINNPDIEQLAKLYDRETLLVQELSVIKSSKGETDMFSMPEKVMLMINGRMVSAIVDSGSQITCVHTKFVSDHLLKSQKTKSITLESAFRERLVSRLVELPCKLVKNQTNGPMRGNEVWLTCAVTDKLGSDCLLSLQDYKDLNAYAEAFIPQVKCITNTDLLLEDDTMKLDDADSAHVLPFYSCFCNDTDHSDIDLDLTDIVAGPEPSVVNDGRANDVRVERVKAGDGLSVEMLINESKDIDMELLQHEDEMLKQYFRATQDPRSGFILRDKLLFRATQISGFEIFQLVVPTCKRVQVMQLAHDSLWSGHYGVRKTIQRIQTHFWWPKMRKQVQMYTASCKPCQMKKRITVADRVPIKAVARPQSNFEVVQIDLIGPIEPPSSSGHKYIISMIDLASRWVDSRPLKSLSAKECCDALLSMFNYTSIPEILISDNATNFVSELSNEMFTRLGIEVRHGAVGHSECQGLVERWNGNLKNLLHLVATSDKPRDWHNKLPFLLFAYRTVPHSTTGLSPYQMVYGTLPRGPLSILSDTFIGKLKDTTQVKKCVAEHMANLEANLALGAKIALQNSEVAQKAYVDQYNKRAFDKQFQVGQQVLVLVPDCANRLISQWIGPVTVISKVSDYTYEVELENGRIRKLHANKLRPFQARVNTLGVVFDDDVDMGDIEVCELSSSNDVEAIESRLSNVDLNHLSKIQQSEMRQLLFKHKDIFQDKPGKCNVGSHEIKLVEGAVPRRQRPYRIPEKLKAEVDKQISEMLAANIIQESNSPWAHPIVCVAKPDGSTRIAVDMRLINSFTVSDAYPIPRTDELLRKIGQAHFISSIDCTMGFHQILMDPMSKLFTAFITDRGLYHYNRMPFGLKNSSATFQRTMDVILRDFYEFAKAYIDDVCVFSKTWVAHLAHLDRVLTALGAAGLTLRLSKCHFAHPQIKYVGHFIGSGQMTSQKTKLDAIRDITMPTTKKAMRTWLGLASYYQMYLKDFSKTARPLYDLIKNSKPLKLSFTDVQVAAFEKLKAELCSGVILHTPCYDQDFVIQTDASDFAVGACLLQIRNGRECPIMFASSKLTLTQARWSIIEREAYAIIFALRKFDAIVFGCKVIVMTDHDPLQYLAKCAPSSGKLTRWALAIQRYSVEIQHRAGVCNQNVDALSRL